MNKAKPFANSKQKMSKPATQDEDASQKTYDRLVFEIVVEEQSISVVFK